MDKEVSVTRSLSVLPLIPRYDAPCSCLPDTEEEKPQAGKVGLHCRKARLTSANWNRALPPGRREAGRSQC